MRSYKPRKSRYRTPKRKIKCPKGKSISKYDGTCKNKELMKLWPEYERLSREKAILDKKLAQIPTSPILHRSKVPIRSKNMHNLQMPIHMIKIDTLAIKDPRRVSKSLRKRSHRKK